MPVSTERDPSLLQIIGQRLRDARVSAGLTLRALSARAGYHWTYLGRVERGEQSPSVRAFLAICAAIPVAPGSLLDDLVPR